MRKITLTASDGEKLTGKLPSYLNWDEVPLAHYAALAAVPDGDVSARCKAVAQLAGLPAQPLLDDVSLLGVILEAAPWLFNGQQLPAVGEPVPVFTHQGVQYHHVGRLAKINAQQMEALLEFLRTNEGHPLTCGPHMLAVLYCPAGQQQTQEVVRDAVSAFASLPMSVAWPALVDFIGSSGSAAANIQTVSALSAQVHQLLTTLETTMTVGDSTTFWRRPLRWLIRTWLRNVRKML